MTATAKIIPIEDVITKKSSRNPQAFQHSHKPKKQLKSVSLTSYLDKLYNPFAKDLLKILRSMNVDVLPHHVVNPVITFEKDAEDRSGDGTHQITKNLYFQNDTDTEPLSCNDDKIPNEVYLHAQEAIGYTTVTLKFDINGTTKTVIGQTICGANDDYNGNFGVILALKNAFDKIEDAEIDHPMINLSHLISNLKRQIEVATMLIVSENFNELKKNGIKDKILDILEVKILSAINS